MIKTKVLDKLKFKNLMKLLLFMLAISFIFIPKVAAAEETYLNIDEKWRFYSYGEKLIIALPPTDQDQNRIAFFKPGITSPDGRTQEFKITPNTKDLGQPDGRVLLDPACKDFTHIDIKINNSNGFTSGPTGSIPTAPSTFFTYELWEPDVAEDKDACKKNPIPADRDGPKKIKMLRAAQFPEVEQLARNYNPDIFSGLEPGGTPETALETSSGTVDSPPVDEVGCAKSLTPLGWVLCPVINLANGVYEFFVGQVNNLLFFERSRYDNTETRELWRTFTTLANSLLIIVGLVIIASQIFNFEFVSAYTVKKALPRLVIGAILIQLSWYIFTSLIQIINALGTGLYDLLLTPFSQYQGEYITINDVLSGDKQSLQEMGWNALGSILFVGIAAGVALSGAWLSLIVILLGALITILVALFVIIIRESLLVILLVLSPVALALWILPGTNKYWKLWWDNFIKLLLMYPLIMLLFAAGTIASLILVSANFGLSKFFAVIAFFAPLFLIGATFKFAGSIFTSLNGISGKLGSMAKGSGMFGLRDRAKFNKENSAWAMSKKSRDADRQRIAQQKYASRLTGGGLYSMALRRNAGTNERGRNRAVASAASQISSDAEQAYKENSVLVEDAIRRIADQDTSSDSYYDKMKKARKKIIGGDSKTRKELLGSVANLDGLAEHVVIQSLKNKDDLPELNTWLQDKNNFMSLKNFGTDHSEAFGVLAEKLPTAAKGDPSASISNTNLRGFNDALNGYSGLAATQKSEVRAAIKAELRSNPSSAVTRLTQLTENSAVSADDLAEISRDIGQGLDLSSLRVKANGSLQYNNGVFSIV